MTSLNNRTLNTSPGNHNKQTVRVMICNGISDQLHDSSNDKMNHTLSHDGLHMTHGETAVLNSAHHLFRSDKRRYIIVKPSEHHEQHMRTMVLAASIADAAIMLVDARKGILSQTRLHCEIAAMLGIRHVVMAVGQMDAVHVDEKTFNILVSDLNTFSGSAGFADIQAIPVPGFNTNDLLRKYADMPWYTGPSLPEYLDTLDVFDIHAQNAFRMQIHWVNQQNTDSQGICGQIIAGTVHPGDAVRILPAGTQTQIKTLLNDCNEIQVGHAGDIVTAILTDPAEINCGDILAAANAPPEIADQFEANLLWLNKNAMIPGRQYLMKLACKEVTATVTGIKYRQDSQTGARLATKTLNLNEAGRVSLSTGAPLIFDRHGKSRSLNSFLLIDRQSLETVGIGMIDFALRRASNIHWQMHELNKATRSAQKKQTPKCVWFTGLSGSGKSTIANLLEKRLYQENKHTYLLDGDNVRHGLCRDLGFTEVDRVENIRRVSEVAKLMVDAGLIVLVSFISPFRSERRMARELFSENEFIEVFVDTDLEECERRDVKGLYAKARSGDLANFTGIDSPYEPPESPEVHIPTTALSPEAAIEHILRLLK
ncbi:adenylyl-sulfate kinase [Nitrosomonas aestuarii]|uniref:adenylyl-sulfate kinase n=1 Tax=Nitrosomonas aestuarii TaxID=52441 RepID=UPI000D30EA3C|nr:adenylyl-sulfate kinase [Nitrosomonas aestuarii]PTN12290.1 bifunctional enzyme CysN/CysC [Nitrosomonas aestuarii]